MIQRGRSFNKIENLYWLLKKKLIKNQNSKSKFKNCLQEKKEILLLHPQF